MQKIGRSDVEGVTDLDRRNGRNTISEKELQVYLKAMSSEPPRGTLDPCIHHHHMSKVVSSLL